MISHAIHKKSSWMLDYSFVGVKAKPNGYTSENYCDLDSKRKNDYRT